MHVVKYKKLSNGIRGVVFETLNKKYCILVHVLIAIHAILRILWICWSKNAILHKYRGIARGTGAYLIKITELL